MARGATSSLWGKIIPLAAKPRVGISSWRLIWAPAVILPIILKRGRWVQVLSGEKCRGFGTHMRPRSLRVRTVTKGKDQLDTAPGLKSHHRGVGRSTFEALTRGVIASPLRTAGRQTPNMHACLSRSFEGSAVS